jgi:hypothetical protein
VEPLDRGAEAGGRAYPVGTAGARDRRNASRASRDAWAWVSFFSALLGLGALAAIAASAFDAGFLNSVPDWAGALLYGTVPSLGLLAVFVGLIGGGWARGRWIARTGVLLGCLLVATALVAVALLLNAFRTAG